MLYLSGRVCDVWSRKHEFHILFVCPVFADIHVSFQWITLQGFVFDVFSSEDCDVHAAICNVGRCMFDQIAGECVLLVTESASASTSDPPSPTSSTASMSSIEDWDRGNPCMSARTAGEIFELLIDLCWDVALDFFSLNFSRFDDAICAVLV
jgi:hypothetical protein